MTEQGLIVDGLLELHGMRDRAVRDLCVRLLGEHLTEPFSFPRHPDDRLDVWQLVDACRSCPGAFWALMLVLQSVHGRTHQLTRVESLVAGLFPEPLLEPRERAELARLLRSIRCAGVLKLYRMAVGPLGPALSADAQDLVAVAQELEEVNAFAGGPPPLLMFIAQIIAEIQEPAATEFRLWTARTASRLGIDVSALQIADRPRPPPADRSASRYYLLVQLVPDAADPDRYLLAAWLQTEQNAGEALRRDDRQLTLAEIQEDLDDLLAEASARMTDAGDLTVEFVLPRALLGWPVDQWEIGVKEGFRRRLGVEYPVVVRSLDRLRNQRTHGRWRRKWRCLQNQGRQASAPVIRWVGQPGQADHEALWASLIRDEEAVCLGLTAPPADLPALGQDELGAGLFAGVPVILWRRDGSDPGAFEAEMTTLLSDSAIADLPELTLRTRQEALCQYGRPGEHLGLHLTLLWDDADRPPEPDARPMPPV